MSYNSIYLLDLIGVCVFAISGALVASRKQMDIVGFIFLATFTGIGGGTLRDVILDRTVFWLLDPAYLMVCTIAAVISYFLAQHLQTRYQPLLWLDAAGLAAFAVLGAEIAVQENAPLPAAVAMGVMTATFGGLVRDVVSGEHPLILKQEIYATAALAAALVFLGGRELGLDREWAAGLGIIAGFALRAAAIRYGLTLPRYRARPGRPQK